MELSVNKAVSHYLMSCYLYYELDVNVYSDYEFDAICKLLYKEYDNITHPHKHLIDKESLLASTGYTIKYTQMIKDAAIKWYEEHLRILNNKYLENK